MPRIENCDFKPNGCDDPRCKLGLCVLDEQEQERAAAVQVAEADEVKEVLWAVMKDVFRTRGHGKPTDADFKRLSKDPKWLALATKRLAEDRALGIRPTKPPTSN